MAAPYLPTQNQERYLISGLGARPRPSDAGVSLDANAVLERPQELFAGRYRFGQKLGAGGVAEVWEAEDVELNRNVAIKILNADTAANDLARARMICEGRALARIRNPHVVDVLDLGMLPTGAPFLVLERLYGWTLRELLRRSPRLPWQSVAHIAAQICVGLEAAHQCNVVHRDLKPENLFISHNAGAERCKILDFGVASCNTPDRLTREGALLGTIRYMSPEQAQGKIVDARSDIYAVGTILFEAIAGHPLVVGTDDQVMLFQIINEPAPRLSDIVDGVPISLVHVVARALTKDPAQRVPTAAALHKLLVPFIGHPSCSGLTLGVDSVRSRICQTIRENVVSRHVAFQAFAAPNKRSFRSGFTVRDGAPCEGSPPPALTPEPDTQVDHDQLATLMDLDRSEDESRRACMNQMRQYAGHRSLKYVRIFLSLARSRELGLGATYVWPAHRAPGPGLGDHFPPLQRQGTVGSGTPPSGRTKSGCWEERTPAAHERIFPSSTPTSAGQRGSTSSTTGTARSMSSDSQLQSIPPLDVTARPVAELTRSIPATASALAHADSVSPSVVGGPVIRNPYCGASR